MTPLQALEFARDQFDAALGRLQPTPIKRLENRDIREGVAEMIRGDRRLPGQPASGGLCKRVIVGAVFYLYAPLTSEGEASLDDVADRLEWALLDLQAGNFGQVAWDVARPIVLLPDGARTAPISILELPTQSGGVFALRVEFGVQIDVPRP